MGMYNEVHYNCPECGSDIIDQTKSGSCQLKRFNHNLVPLAEVSGLESDLWCDNCNTHLEVKGANHVALTLVKSGEQ